jgi:hypothetical protein
MSVEKNLRCPGCGHLIKGDHSSQGCVHIDDEGAFTCNCKLSKKDLREFLQWKSQRCL